jgi:hypothetical protein
MHISKSPVSDGCNKRVIQLYQIAVHILIFRIRRHTAVAMSHIHTVTVNTSGQSSVRGKLQTVIWQSAQRPVVLTEIFFTVCFICDVRSCPLQRSRLCQGIRRILLTILLQLIILFPILLKLICIGIIIPAKISFKKMNGILI